jgi:phosphoserine phosphatase RsbU/P
MKDYTAAGGDAMATLNITEGFLREQLIDRRQRLEALMGISPGAEQVARLLQEVDAALARLDAGSYGICEACHEPVEKERLIADPLLRYCLDHLTTEQRSALERDLELASRIQRDMLPQQHARHAGWEIFYRYRALGPVSGDYCDVLTDGSGGESVFFAVGDVSGKGVAASMLMARLHAIFRTLNSSALALQELVTRASSVFRESALPPYYATLVCGKANSSGEIEICNAGHCPPLWLQNGKISTLEATGIPFGLFSDSHYALQVLNLAPGDGLFLYTDGLSEACNGTGEEFGESRLAEAVKRNRGLAPNRLVDACLSDLERFLAGAPLADDLSIMAIQRC